MLIWKAQTVNVNIASLRYRCLFPLRYLNQLGIESIVCSNQEPLEVSAKTEAIIFVKSFRDQDVITCERAYQLGVPVILDLCDNIFIDGYAPNSCYVPAQNFRVMARRATAIVTTGEALKAAVEDFLRPLVGEVYVVAIPDGSETLDDIDYSVRMTQWRRLEGWVRQKAKQKTIEKQRGFNAILSACSQQKNRAQRWFNRFSDLLVSHKSEPLIESEQLIASSSVAQLESTTEICKKSKKATSQPIPLVPDPWPKAAKGVKTVLWFGNHGAKYGNFGMLNILDVAPALHVISQLLPLRLVVVSNSREKYEQHIEPLPFETTYLRWHPRKMYEYIRASDVVIVPNSQSAFSICKSANRAVLALSQGTPVVASHTPALDLLSECIWLDDWEAGLREYLLNPSVVKAHLATAQQVIEANFSGEVIAQKWLKLLNQVLPSAARSTKPLAERAVLRP